MGPISDYRLATRIVRAAGVALPTMYAITIVGIWAASFKLGPGPLTQPYAAVKLLTFCGFVALGAWLVWRMSRIASVLVVALTVTVAAAMDYFIATKTIRVGPTLWVAEMAPSFWVFAGFVVPLAAGWSATALLSWRAMRAAFAAERLRSSAPTWLEGIFD